ncbi:hypothetical protein ACFL3D_01980, partial [Candidatus Omnitrophota bacterium]
GKQREIDLKYNPPRKYLDWKKKAELIRKGKVKMRLPKVCHRLEDLYDFSPWENPGVDLKKHKEKRDKLTARTTEIKDKIMLGDSQEALELIEKFNNEKI